MIRPAAYLIQQHWDLRRRKYTSEHLIGADGLELLEEPEPLEPGPPEYQPGML
jgi:hypothetical protein